MRHLWRAILWTSEPSKWLFTLSFALLCLGIAAAVTARPLVYTAALIAPFTLVAVAVAARLIGRTLALRKDPATGLLRRSGVTLCLDEAIRQAQRAGQSTAAIVLEINDFKLTQERYDHASIENALRTIGERLRVVLRSGDAIGRLDGPTFAIAVAAAPRLDLEAAINLSTRLQQAVARPIPMGSSNLHVSASVGFCLSDRIETPGGSGMLQGATTAMIEAERNSPGGIRAYSTALRSRIISRNSLSTQVSKALDNGELKAFFQPQVAVSDRHLTGFEALARWEHPIRGMISPAEFLPALEQAGLMEQLGRQMVSCALSAVVDWDEQGLYVPHVAVNFSTDELRNPHLVTTLSDMIERRALTPDRLSIEVLETVVAGAADDQVVQTLAGLSELGCHLDLDDFGTGHASITNIRRFSIQRIKIDRSFITKIDQDAEQQMMFAAILTMADRLGLATLAEGVETSGELAMLAELGCEYVQGFGIARPMPLEETTGWIRANAKGVLASLPRKVG